MRRGLKPYPTMISKAIAASFKPIPDEEGTETNQAAQTSAVTHNVSFKPIPDEEGTETPWESRA